MSTQFTNRQWRLPNNENKDKQSNYSMDFDSTSQYIDLGNLDFLNTANALTISFWFKADDALDSNWQTFLANGSLNPVSNLWCGLTRSNWSSVVDGTSIQPTFSLKINGANSIVGGWGGNITTASPNPLVNGNWYHFCGTWDGSTQKLYIDGQLKGSLSTTGSIDTTTNETYIGASPNPTSYYFDGSIDALSIFNYALSSSQITTLYGSSSTGIGNPITLNPVAYYPLGDQDSFNGANYLVPNSSLKDYVFDGYPGGTKLINSNINQSNTGGKFTISFWHKYNGSGLVGFNHGGGKIGQFRYYAQPIVYLSSSYYQYFNISTSTLLANTNWQHFVVFIDTSNVTNSKLWIDGSSISSAGYGTGGSANSFTSGLQLDLGAFPEISNMMYFTNYEINQTNVDVLYNNGVPITSTSGLSTAPNHWWKLDASDTYDSSTGNWTIEDHVGSNDGTSSGMTQANLVQSDLSFTSGYSPYALSFDAASSQYINVANNSSINISGDLSLSAWINVNDLSSFRSIISKRDSTVGYEMVVRTSGEISFYTDSGQNSKSTATVSLNTWTNIIITVESGVTNGTKIYFNGVADTWQSGGTHTIVTNTNTLNIGRRYGTTWYFDGKLSNASIWNTALTSAQVSEIYNEGVPSNLNNHSAYSSLVSWWQLGSNSSFNTNWTVVNEISTGPNGVSANMTEANIVDGVGSYANGLSSGMGGDEVIGDAPYSKANSLSVNMDVLDRVTDTPS